MIIWILVAKKRNVHSLDRTKPTLSNLTNIETSWPYSREKIVDIVYLMNSCHCIVSICDTDQYLTLASDGQQPLCGEYDVATLSIA